MEPPIFEDGLQDYLTQYGNSERLNFSAEYNESIFDSDAIFVAVGTPQKADGSADLQYIFSSVREAAKYVNSNCIFVIKSTVPPGTCRQARRRRVRRRRIERPGRS